MPAVDDRTILRALVPVTLFALLAAIVSLFWLRGIQDQRAQDRVTADSRACDNANELRGQIVEAHEANLHAQERILDLALNGLGESLRAELQGPLDDYQQVLDDIDLIDCEEAIPGYLENATSTGGSP